ncbi:hypothetical protein ITP53_44150 [Nonomuraea sp. K274]|uniref:Uncharacterized protein n=1 Tax=Nonomuraea cypriaca TaxID=1187855 RepID=A0A931F5Y0_9ACTN|nr:hypothetical protein [Nonomuraea cypriaca]MBF8192561.1 hypothetical protein [Nonomuraea cypriaca]
MLVLLVNDHLLKQVWPGFVTGKLSDVAGLLVAPALLALLFWRRADLAATLLTGVLFTLVKSTETGAEAASHVWTLVAGPSRVLADPTDLLALPALALAWWVRGRSLSTHSPRRSVLLTVPLAVLAVTATAAASPPYAADSVEVDKSGRITVHLGRGTTQVSEDGGATWSRSTGEHVKPRQTAACVPGQATRCYRVARDRLGVEQSDDGGRTWGPSWALSGDDGDRLTRQYDEGAGLRSVALGVQARPGGGHVVVVANGLDGILVRDTTGTWRRAGVPGEPTGEVDLHPEMSLAVLLAACVLFGGAGAGLRRPQHVYMGAAVVASGGAYLVMIGWDALFDPGPWLLLLGGAMTLAGGLVCLTLAVTGPARAVPSAAGVLGAPLVYASVYTPFYGWSVGLPGAYEIAVALAALLTGLVLLTGAALIRRDARRTDLYAGGASTSRPT